MIEPGALVIGVSEEGVLHQLQLCRSQGGTGLRLGVWWDPGCPNILPAPWRTSRPHFTVCWLCTVAVYLRFISPTRHLSSLLSGAECYAPPEPGTK